MIRTLKILVTILLVGFSSHAVLAQKDTTKVKLKKIDNEINEVKSTNQLKAKSTTTRVNPSSNFNLGITKKLNNSAVQKNLKKPNPNSNQNFLAETKPEDMDIIGKRFWNNKDVTHTKLVSSYSLGTISSFTKSVRVECRDYSLIDGDRITIYLNEKPVSTNIGLKTGYYVFFINLEQGYNRIDFKALNQGYSGPNTAELNVYDEKGTLISSKEWSLQTGQTATLGVIRKQ